MKNTILFFDDYMLRSYVGVRKRFFNAQNMSLDILPDNPKEVGGRIMYTPESNNYRFWRKVLDINTDKIIQIKVYSSDDLKSWQEMPEYRISAEDDATKGFLGGHITRDKFEPDPQKRYKSTYMIKNKDNTGTGMIAESPDGLHWNTDTDNVYCNHISDTINNTFYNPIFNEYQTILRAGFIERRIFCKTSKDMKSWSKARCLMMPNPHDEPCVEYYGMSVFPMDGYFLGYLWKYKPPMFDSAKTKMAGKTDTYLVYSYDGFCWNFASDSPVVERPMPPAHGSASIYLSSLDESIDNKSWILSGDIRRIDHACGFKPVYPDSEIPKLAKQEGFAATGLYEVRKEGFAALESISNESEITFKRIMLNGEDLFFNICAPLGWAKFQICDDKGVIPGYSYEDNIAFMDGDEIRYRPEWKNKDLSALKGKSIIIQVKMYTCLLFSVTGDFYTHNGYFPAVSLGNQDNPLA